MDKNLKNNVINECKRSANDTGSVYVQIALLDERIKQISGHLNKAKHDYSAQAGLIKIVGRRRRYLQYLQKHDHAGYVEFSARLRSSHD